MRRTGPRTRLRYEPIEMPDIDVLKVPPLPVPITDEAMIECARKLMHEHRPTPLLAPGRHLVITGSIPGFVGWRLCWKYRTIKLDCGYFPQPQLWLKLRFESATGVLVERQYYDDLIFRWRFEQETYGPLPPEKDTGPYR